MNIQEAKSIRLVDFLAGLGHHPVIQRGNSVWYKSPFRMEKEASFKIDLRKELWYDFGLGKGGDIITLAKEIYRTDDISLVLRYIEDKKAVLKPVTISCPVEEAAPAFQELKIRPLANRILLAYLKERCIDVETAGKICREASFKRNGKNYFAIAFPNISGGYEVRNRFFKACISPKDITCTHTQVVTFGVMSFERNNQIAQAFSVGELSEHHCKELIPTSQVFDVTVSIIFCNNTVKFTSIEECD